MSLPPESWKCVSFGEFKFDRQSGELRSNGHRSALQEKPFQVLLALLERPGELITRKELKERLWRSDTFVDFDHGFNKAVNRLREALHDSAEQPRYVETVARRGYRLMVSVELSEPSAVCAPSLPVGLTRPLQGTSVTESTSHPRTPANTLRRNYVWAALLLGGLVVFLTGFMTLRWREGHDGRVLSEVHSLAVLPLENLSGDPTQEYFADGMTDAMITDLGKLGTLKVISRTSVMRYKGVHKPLSQIARELNVDAVVEGTVLRSGDQVRITAQLIDAQTDRHLWAQSYDGDLRDVLGLQAQVANSIADHIVAKLARQEQPLVKNRPLPNPEAQDAYLRGHHFAQKGTIQDLQKAVVYFEEAIQKDSTQAAPHAGLASAYVQLGHILYLNPQESFPLAKTAALKALALDHGSDEAHTALGNASFLYDWDFAGAEREFQLAIRLNPNSVHAQSSYSSFLNAMGHPDDALAHIQQALQIDPLSLPAITDVAWQLYWARRYDDAIAQARKVVEIDPAYYPAHVCLGLAYEQKHQFSSSVAELKSATGFCRDKCFGLIGQVSALSGDRAGALEALRQLQRRPYVSSWLVSIVYAELGDDHAFLWLEKAYQGREHDLAFANVWPMFDRLRPDPRFKDLIRRIGLPQGI